jgi:signal transduction histidine kinase
MRQGGTLSISAAPDAAGSFAIIDIADTGPGIAPEHLPRIFDPFFTTKAAGQGTGLGLYVSYGIIQEHGGTIGVESPETGGTLVRIRLPLAGNNEEKD